LFLSLFFLFLCLLVPVPSIHVVLLFETMP
jgi:hypothetical protein